MFVNFAAGKLTELDGFFEIAKVSAILTTSGSLDEMHEAALERDDAMLEVMVFATNRVVFAPQESEKPISAVLMATFLMFNESHCLSARQSRMPTPDLPFDPLRTVVLEHAVDSVCKGLTVSQSRGPVTGARRESNAGDGCRMRCVHDETITVMFQGVTRMRAPGLRKLCRLIGDGRV